MAIGVGPSDTNQFNYNYRNETVAPRYNTGVDLMYGALIGMTCAISLLFCYYNSVNCIDKYKKRTRLNRITTVRKLDTLTRTSSTCPICIQEYAKNDVIRQLPCDHHFHKTCVDPWIVNYRGDCPMCRQDIVDEP